MRVLITKSADKKAIEENGEDASEQKETRADNKSVTKFWHLPQQFNTIEPLLGVNSFEQVGIY